jgi:hypothetical protein
MKDIVLLITLSFSVACFSTSDNKIQPPLFENNLISPKPSDVTYLSGGSEFIAGDGSEHIQFSASSNTIDLIIKTKGFRVKEDPMSYNLFDKKYWKTNPEKIIYYEIWNIDKRYKGEEKVYESLETLQHNESKNEAFYKIIYF